MINAVGRDIPEEILEMTGKEVFQGNHYRDGYVYKKDGPYTKCVVNNTQSKLVANIHDVLVKCGIKDGMTLGFHHHFREGDCEGYILNLLLHWLIVIVGEVERSRWMLIDGLHYQIGRAHV